MCVGPDLFASCYSVFRPVARTDELKTNNVRLAPEERDFSFMIPGELRDACNK